ncbi:cobyrinic acid a,c-diamide synthase [Halomonas sp. M20]|uniref:cobyrinic acid a,c-diamide synthase n=1 Tax=Halomonas sp. M20 TaxID=2763264 RepID=UPI001D09A2F6|nr:cobyrinic acid a,c-diamide synthase [Halomonas sp. M20]
MLGFLQGFAYGLFITCLPWFLIGMISPGLALGTLMPDRLQVVIRYWLTVPFVAMLLWMTSLWGGFGPSLLGWLAGLGAVAVAVPIERRIRGWLMKRKQRRLEAQLNAEKARRQQQQAQEASEKGGATLDPQHPPMNADDVIRALCTAKERLIAVSQPQLAVQADRLYNRYLRVTKVLQERFDTSELAFERSRTLVSEVCFAAVDNLTSMAAQASGIAGVDGDFVRRRLSRERNSLSLTERATLERRLTLLTETQQHLDELSARNEAALTALDDAAVTMARIETGRPQASIDADQALRDLSHFVERAERYGRPR